ncbi:MAG TPA: sugar ABC transporter permease [Actinopolymorphaceae bacterium]
MTAATTGQTGTAGSYPDRTPQRQGRQKTRWRARHRRALVAWLFMLPLLLVNGVVIAGPGIASLYYSFTSWTGVGDAEWVGLANYRRLLSDENFLSAFWHNIWWTIFFLTVPMTMGLLGAYLVSRVRRFQMFFRLAYFIPYIIATVVSAAIWQNILSPEYGIGAQLAKFGIHVLDDVNFLGDGRLALPSVAFVNNWQWWGFLLVVFLAAMQGVNPSLYEAARLDGANAWQEFRYITLPAIRPTVVFLALMTIIWSFLVFDYVYILTRGGPAGATEVLGTLLYTAAFGSHEAGYAAAIGVVMAAISFVVVCGYLVLRRTRGWET